MKAGETQGAVQTESSATLHGAVPAGEAAIAGGSRPLCATCRHFDKAPPTFPVPEGGLCRRYPPTGQQLYRIKPPRVGGIGGNESAIVTNFPIVTSNDWCGEHGAR